MQVFLRKKRSGNIFVKKPDVGPDGLLVEIINSLRCPPTYAGGCLQSSEVIFTQVAVSADGDSIAAGDVHGNLFCVNLVKNRFHLVKHLSMPCSRISISLKRKTDMLVSLSDYSVRCFNTETQEQLACLRGHQTSIVNISVHSSKRYALITSSETASLWNLDTLERKRKLSIAQNVDLLAALFIPNSNSMLTCFKDNSMLVWDAESMDLKYELRSSQSLDVTYRVFTCNSDGSSVACAGKSNLIHIWDIPSQKIHRVLQLAPETKQVKQLEYLPKHLYPEEVLLGKKLFC